MDVSEYDGPDMTKIVILSCACENGGDYMRIGFVGAGKVGFTLGKYMTERDVHVSGYYSRNKESAKLAAEFTNTLYFDTIEELLESSDALFLTVPDGTIEQIWNSLKQYSLKSKFICHCSGAMSTAVFSNIDQTGAFGYSIHPLVAINDKMQSYRDISQTYFTIEGSKEHIDYWCTFFEGLGNPVRVIDKQDKVLYHSAAVFASNFVVGLYDVAVDILTQCGFDKESASKAIAPLFLNNCKNVAEHGSVDALTGPIERADENTINKHLDALDGNNKEIYKSLSNVLIRIAEEKHSDKDYTRLKQMLRE